MIEGLRKIKKTLPGVLIAVVLATVLSAVIGYEQKVTIELDQISDQQEVENLRKYQEERERMAAITTELASISQRADALEKEGGLESISAAATIRTPAAALEYEYDQLKKSVTSLQIELHALSLQAFTDTDGSVYYRHVEDDDPQGDGKRWRYDAIKDGKITLSAGGDVVGTIPQGLPSLAVPVVHWDLVLALLPAAIVMALIGFMEATSISKAIATKTGDRVDTNRELVGQGLANIAGSFFNSYTVSGSFSRSAVASRMGAVTGLFAITSALAVVLVLLFFTQYLPQAVLAVIVMMAVFGLIRIKPLVQAWKADRIGAVIGIITFFATLIMAPAIANGIVLGVILTILVYLENTMKPRADIVSRKPNGTLGGIKANKLEPMSECFVPVRFDGSLTFINVAYFEDIILEAHADFPNARFILVIGSGINDIDASGEEKIREVAERLRKVGVRLVFSGLKHQVYRIFQKANLVEELGNDVFYSDKESALRALQNETVECERDRAAAKA